MLDFQWLLDKAKNLNFNEFIKHLRNYLSLYTNPYGAWKKAISNRKEGFDFIILHIIYYTIFVVFVLEKKDSIIPSIFFELIVNIVPVMFFIVPFLIFNKIFKKNYNWIKLFRLFLIIKLQISPILGLLILSIEYLKLEGLYILLENLLYSIFFLYIVIFPLLVRISVWKKIFWIVGNYLTFLVEFYIIFLGVYKYGNSKKLLERTAINTPNQEYAKFISNNVYPLWTFNDNFYLVKVSGKRSGKSYLVRPQFVSDDLFSSFTDSHSYELDALKKSIDSLTAKDSSISINQNTFAISKIIKHKKLTIGELDSIKIGLDEKFKFLLTESTRLKDSSKFESNREYFKALNIYLIEYNELFTDSTKITEIIESSKALGQIGLDNNDYVIMFKLNKSNIRKSKKKLKDLEMMLDDRMDNSSLVLHLLFFPIELIFDYLIYSD